MSSKHCQRGGALTHTWAIGLAQRTTTRTWSRMGTSDWLRLAATDGAAAAAAAAAMIV